MFIPLNDVNKRSWIRYHYVTIALIAACVFFFYVEIAGGEQAFARIVYGFGTIPSVLFGIRDLPPGLSVVPAWLTLVTGIFLHGGIMHLLGNMLFLWVFGDNVEDAMGHGKFLLFYLLCGIIASLSHAVLEPGSDVPLIGASGAISGVLGAYFVLHPRVQVWVLLFAFIPVRLPTFIVLGAWALLQVVYTFNSTPETQHVAWWAHIAGFAAGAWLIRYFRYPHVALWDTSETGSLEVGGLRLRSGGWNRNRDEDHR